MYTVTRVWQQFRLVHRKPVEMTLLLQAGLYIIQVLAPNAGFGSKDTGKLGLAYATKEVCQLSVSGKSPLLATGVSGR